MRQYAIQRTRSTGFSLIELLVSMFIGLIVTLAITSVMIRSESSKRSTTSVNDINQTGAYAAFVLDREIRSAGSGFSQHWTDTYGCQLNAKYNAVAVLPLPAAFSATSAFVNMPQTFRLAPVLIAKDAANVGGNRRGDVLVSMGGTSGFAETGSPLTAIDALASPPSIGVPTAMGYFDPVTAAAYKTLVLLADASVLSGCLVTEVTASDNVQSLSLGGAYSDTDNLGSFQLASSNAMQLGRESNNPPNFHMYAVGANNTLMSYDLLAAPTADVPVADGVVEMRALYGLDTSNPPDGVLDSWIDPGAAGYDAATLSNGSPTSLTRLRQIVAVRVGFILRTSLEEKAASQGGYDAPNSVSLFTDAVDGGGTSLTITRPVPAADQHYRFRTFEATIPLRNVMLAP